MVKSVEMLVGPEQELEMSRLRGGLQVKLCSVRSVSPAVDVLLVVAAVVMWFRSLSEIESGVFLRSRR